MKWMDDPCWQGALRAALALSPEHTAILTPDEFVHKRAEFYPLRQAGQLSFLEQWGEVTAFAIPKDYAKLLPPKILRDLDRRFHCVFANEVFVIYSALAETQTLTEEMEKHIPAFLEQREECLSQWAVAENPGAPISGKRLPYILDTQENRILKTLFPDKNYVMEQFMDLSGAPEIIKREVFKYCVSRVSIELSAFCNRNCHYCPVSFLEKRKDKTAKMSRELFQRCVEELVEIDYDGTFWFCLFNEPLHDREFLLAALDYVGRMLPKCFIKIVSNGDYLTPEYFRELTRHRIDEFCVSVHYDGIWDRDKQAERISEIIKRIGLPEHGDLTEGDQRLIYYVDPASYNSILLKAFALRTEDFSIHGMDRGGALNSGVLLYRNLDHCQFPMDQLNIAYDGTVVPCCNMCSDVPGMKKWAYGTVQEHGDIFSAYTCGKAVEFRRRFFAPRREDEYTPEQCRTCSVAEYDGEAKIHRLDDPIRREIYDRWISKLE